MKRKRTLSVDVPKLSLLVDCKEYVSRLSQSLQLLLCIPYGHLCSVGLLVYLLTLCWHSELLEAVVMPTPSLQAAVS